MGATIETGTKDMKARTLGRERGRSSLSLEGPEDPYVNRRDVSLDLDDEGSPPQSDGSVRQQFGTREG